MPTEIRLGLTESETSLALWPHTFDLEIVVTVAARLQVELIARNPGDQPFVCGGALHSYYTVGDARQIAIDGLDGCDYLDKVEGFKRKPQHGPVTITGETDRVYLDTDATCVIEIPRWRRRIGIAKAGSRTTVVWNPWAEKAKQIADFEDEEYLSMVCVETANADTDVATVAPGGEHRLSAAIGLE